MALSLRCHSLTGWGFIFKHPRPVLQPRLAPLTNNRTFITSSHCRATSTETYATTEPSWADSKEKTRLVPASPSYFTGNADFFDNWLELEELLRRYQTLPTVPITEAPHVKWKTLAQYSNNAGQEVKSAKYKKIIDTLNRLNCIDPSLIPEEVKSALEFYKRDVEGAVSQAKPKSLDGLGRAYGLGRRKTSVAKVWVLEGDGRVLINGQPLSQIFERVHDRESAVWPLIATKRMDKYNVWATVEGGGKTGQAEALTLGVARALLVHEPALKPALRRAGTVTRDPRMVERKKPGHLKARKMPTWVKR
ncbi:ribosomal protein S5 domain 2-type protein [Geopyxis carbonaria]|nr:ribosomal protein S5 domain 2-type protein [Geopyxis carbonaria]